MQQPQIFISYSHRDHKALAQFQRFAVPLERDGYLKSWADTDIQGGADWHTEIIQAIDAAAAAVLFISQDFLASEFIWKEELPRILAREDAGTLKILPVFLRPSTVEDLTFSFVDRKGMQRKAKLTEFQGYGTPQNTLSERSEPEQERIYAQLIGRIKKLAEQAEVEEPTKPRSKQAPDPLSQQTATGRLQFLRGSPVEVTRLFTKPTLVLGRARLSADLWLTLYPMDDTHNQTLMNGMSESHAVIHLGERAEIRDDHSKQGTNINATPLGSVWRVLQDGDLIGFRQEALQLRARVAAEQWLRLDRVNNGVELENYLLLRDNAALSGGEAAAIPVPGAVDKPLAVLQRAEGGYVIVARETPVTVNGRVVEEGIVGLRDDDRVEVGSLAFNFWAGAYPQV